MSTSRKRRCCEDDNLNDGVIKSDDVDQDDENHSIEVNEEDHNGVTMSTDDSHSNDNDESSDSDDEDEDETSSSSSSSDEYYSGDYHGYNYSDDDEPLRKAIRTQKSENDILELIQLNPMAL